MAGVNSSTSSESYRWHHWSLTGPTHKTQPVRDGGLCQGKKVIPVPSDTGSAPAAPSVTLITCYMQTHFHRDLTRVLLPK